MGKVKAGSKPTSSIQAIKNQSKIKFNYLEENINVNFMVFNSSKESIQVFQEFKVSS